MERDKKVWKRLGNRLGNVARNERKIYSLKILLNRKLIYVIFVIRRVSLFA